jgi:two-component system sensor histidine kinase KdpD
VSLIGSHLSHQARQHASEALVLGRRKDQAEMAKRSAETKSALVASLSHDVKTPLTALTVAAGNLETAELPEHLKREQLQIIQTELGRLKRLFDNMIDLASVEAQATTPELEWVSPSDIVEAARHQVDATIRTHPMKIAGDAEPPLVFLDPRLTTSALAHVLENAARYSPSDAPIEIGVSTESTRLSISVRDHGPGIPNEDLGRIFERFYRGRNASHDTFRSGMGLAITRGLLEQQGGRISVANHREGGAMFTLEIPIAQRQASELSTDVA